MTPRPDLVLIVGCPRSGTTWLQMMMLPQHPKIVSVQEPMCCPKSITPLLTSTDRQREASRLVGLGAIFDGDQVADMARCSTVP